MTANKVNLVDRLGIPLAAELERMLAAGELPRLGAGSRRACYEIPGTDLCLKCYRDESTASNATVAREIGKCRHDERRNTCCQEYRYYQELKRRLPGYVFAAYPERLEQVRIPSRGWCLLESRVRNADGTQCGRFSETYRAADKATQTKLLKEFWLLVGAFAAYGVRFYDPQNVLVQHLADGTFRLRVVDFEPASRTLFPIDSLCPAIVRAKVIRRARRYLMAHCGVKMRYKGLKPAVRRKWDRLIATEGAKMGLTDCRAFLENKMVNDIFYRGAFGGRSCVVKCSSRAPDTIANESKILQRLNGDGQSLFPKVLACSEFNGHAIMIAEEIKGPSLAEVLSSQIPPEGANRYAEDLVRILLALQAAGIVHRDMMFSNLLEGPDGHLRLIDFQLAVSRADYAETAWARRHPSYLYVVFGVPWNLPLGTWNDAAGARLMLKALPPTPEVLARIRELEERVQSFLLVTRIPWPARLRLFAHRLSLGLQLCLSRGGSEKRRRLEQRCARFANGGRGV